MTITLQAVNELIQSLESAGELSIREQKFLKLAKEFRICSASLDAAIKTGNVLADQNSQLAAENAALKDINAWCKTDAFKNMYREFKTAEAIGCSDVDCMHDAMLVAIMHAPETPATDRIVAGIKADGRAEGINFAASRLAAAFNHGFVDKPMAEVGDVVRMILTAKEDLANDPVLAADGLSGEYAEKSLAEWEAALSEGASYD
ncbi:hypothetical protein [Klebsiella quasipneumoniae]|uniref:hypothetical protein n=1 Tax=Klebsiella quasipneumoniae TaxID=1463165 RepID=UPI003A4DDA89